MTDDDVLERLEYLYQYIVYLEEVIKHHDHHLDQSDPWMTDGADWGSALTRPEPTWTTEPQPRATPPE